MDNNIEIEYRTEKSLTQLKYDTNALLNYVTQGNKLHGVLFSVTRSFLPLPIKQRLYIIDSIQFNGSPCYVKKHFVNVIKDIEQRQQFQKIKKLLWNISIPKKASFLENFKYLKKFADDIKAIFTMIDQSKSLCTSIKKSSNLRITALNNDQLTLSIHDIEYGELLHNSNEIKTSLDKASLYLQHDNFHPIAKEILNNINTLDIESYQKGREELEIIKEQQSQYTEFKTLKNELITQLPDLTQKILSGEFKVLDQQGTIEQAIAFKHAQNTIKTLINIDAEKSLSLSIKKAETQEKELISKIASNKAWLHVLERLGQDPFLERHLTAFAQAARTIGSGKGQAAQRFIKIAQKEMEQCKTSVPCWIMPLYKVIESIYPEQGMYDYVIIDEASQLGADAIFLLYIAKKIIIVGDDKQTSPEYIGLQDNVMAPHIQQHLENIPFKEFYGAESSFFDHAKRFCNGKIVLREHFRCMPEIIEFSDKYFYKTDGIGLYPLKQYSQNRLQPLNHSYCQKGHIDGTGTSIINKPEAKMLVKEIAHCIKNKEYDKKSIGIIVLQGHTQADIIEALLLKEIGEPEFKKRKIVCGNSTSFQGDERDIIFLSLVTAHNHNSRALTSAKDERRFNVAVSRAKEQLWLFHSVQLEELSNKNDLRYKLLDHVINYNTKENIGTQLIPIPPIRPRPLKTQPAPFDSWFEVDVYNDIIRKGYSVIAQYEIANRRYIIDLVLILPNGTKIAIECDGDYWHNAENYEKDMMRQKDLERSGWQFFRVRGSVYYANRKEALEPLWELLPDLPLTPPEAEIIEPEKVKPKIVEIPTEDKIPNKQIDLPLTASTQKSNIQKISEFLVFTNKFNVYKLKDKGETKRQALEIIKSKFNQNEKQVCHTIKVDEFSGFLIIAFENGKIAKVNISAYETKTARTKLANAYGQASQVVSIEYFKNDERLVVISSAQKVVVFDTVSLTTNATKGTNGSQVITLTEGNILQNVKRLGKVNLQSVDYYYRPNLPATGNNLKNNDSV